MTQGSSAMSMHLPAPAKPGKYNHERAYKLFYLQEAFHQPCCQNLALLAGVWGWVCGVSDNYLYFLLTFCAHRITTSATTTPKPKQLHFWGDLDQSNYSLPIVSIVVPFLVNQFYC